MRSRLVFGEVRPDRRGEHGCARLSTWKFGLRLHPVSLSHGRAAEALHIGCERRWGVELVQTVASLEPLAQLMELIVFNVLKGFCVPFSLRVWYLKET